MLPGEIVLTYARSAIDTQTFSGKIEHRWQTASNNTLRWGLDVQNNDLLGEADSTNPERITFNETEEQNVFQTSLFALNTWKITDAFQADFGARANFDSQFGSYVNPSAGLWWAGSPVIALRGSLASVQRNPGLDQLYVYDTVHNWFPNADLEPETGAAWTAGVDVNFSPSLTGQFTYFGSSLSDRLGIGEGNRWQNIGKVDTNGVEAALRWQMSPRWSTFLNYTYTDATIKSGPEAGRQLSFVPYSVASLGIGYESKGWQVNLFANYSSGTRRAFFLTGDDVNTDFTSSFLNLDLTGRIPLSRTLALTWYLENLTDEQYERVNRTYSPGLTFRVGLQSIL